MFTGTAEQLRAAELRAATIADQIAELLNKLDTAYPGSTHGQVTFLGGDITKRGNRWTVNTDR